MNVYDELRRQAHDKRDDSIRAAREEYTRRLREINNLRDNLLGKPSKTAALPAFRPILVLMHDCMPRQGTFTLDELVELMRAAEPWRRFQRTTVRATLTTLKNDGAVAQDSRGAQGRVNWRYVGPRQKPVAKFAAKTLTDAAADVLAELGPLRTSELAMALQDRGYRTDAKIRTLVDSIRKSLRYAAQRFTEGTDGRWTVR